MPKGMPSRERLEELVALAQSYRDLTRRDVAERLGRDVHNLIPETGNPKVDFVVKLAELLDWSVEMVIEEIYERHGEGACDRRPRTADDAVAIEARDANRRAWDLLRAERWTDAAALLRATIAGPAPSQAKAYASQLLVTSLESQGLYLEALEAARAGLVHATPGSRDAMRLRALLAFSHYVTGSIYEAEGLAGSIIAELTPASGGVERGDPERQTLAFACFVRGHARRCIATAGLDIDDRLAAAAIGDLERAVELLEDYAARGTVEWDAGLAEIARAGVFEIRALAGEIPAERAVELALAKLEGTERIDRLDSTSAEALGWWCVFAANVVLRRIPDAELRDRLLGILTNKADEVASRLGHWALRERVLMLEHQSDALGTREARDRAEALDSEDLKCVAGTMSRFPDFRAIGWQILRARRPVDRRGGS